MSHQINTQLLEEAAQYIDLYVDTTLGGMLERAVDFNDLDMVRELVMQCRRQDETNKI